MVSISLFFKINLLTIDSIERFSTGMEDRYNKFSIDLQLKDMI